MNSRQKGARGERELANVLKGYGYKESRRGQQYCGSNGDADVVGLTGIHIECKRVEKLNLEKAMEHSRHMKSRFSNVMRGRKRHGKAQKRR